MQTAITSLLVVVGLINMAPLLAVTSAQRVSKMYGVDVASADLEIVLRHRAVLLGIVGGLIIVGGFFQPLRWAGIAAGAVSMASFVALALLVDGYGAPIRRVVIADVIGLVFLAAAALLMMSTGTKV